MKFLNFGSLNIDKVYTVPHFVTAGETLSSVNYAEYAGGKGLNQSIALAKSGASVYHAGKIGKDGLFLKKELDQAGVKVDGILEDGFVTGHAIIQVNESGENCILLFGGANREIEMEQVDRVLADFQVGDFLVLQNEINCGEYIIDAAHEKGITIALNPSPMNASIRKLDLTKIDYLILNELEGREITGRSEPGEILDHLLTTYNNLKVVLTLGTKGSIYRDAVQEFKQRIFEADVVDTTAAGDTFMGYFLCTVAKNGNIVEALEVASKAASVTVSRSGAAKSIPFLDEVS
ncbi:ribokinase [Sutcliffiella sp. NPDC057660]|uniref:ribokinase n=1 Tax=Sutcliffiella sp. NPDC057660 TaxID=3346199 RepID=UPI0036C0DA24